MKKHPLQEILEVEGSYPCRGYQGRGMRNECLAVTLEQGDDALGLAGTVITALGHDSDAAPEDIEEIGFAFQNAREDNLGKGRVVYFPDIEFVA